ncbi:hypothetical protein FO519_005100 [Halicephalobus sp. NKZ332]|nr:hypothetical protein FO519_005100 [Halicephalobus sp. NKZ332]
MVSKCSHHRKRSRRGRDSVSFSSSTKIEHAGPSLILIFNFHHAYLDVFDLKSRKVTSEKLSLSSQKEINHLTLIEKVFSGGYNLSEIDIEKGGEGIPRIPKDEIMSEIIEVFSKGEPYCRNLEDVAAIVAVCDFAYLNQRKYFQRALSKIPFYQKIQEKLRIMSSSNAPYIPYFFDSGLQDFSKIEENSYIAIIRQGSHRTDAVLFRYVEGTFKGVNVINRFKERGFSEEESMEFIDSLRTVHNNVLAECFVYILELKKGSSFPTFTKILEGKNAVFLLYEQSRSEIIDNYMERMGIDLDIYAEKDAEQQKLSGRYAVTMQGMKQISNQQRFIDKSRFPLKRAPPPPGKIVNMDPYAETSMSPLQYIRFLRAATTLPKEKQSKRVRDQGPLEPGSPDEAPPMDIVEAMCGDQIDQEVEDSENFMNFDDEWIEKFGEKSMNVTFKSRFEGNPMLKFIEDKIQEPKKKNVVLEKKIDVKVDVDWRFGDEDGVVKVVPSRIDPIKESESREPKSDPEVKEEKPDSEAKDSEGKESKPNSETKPTLRRSTRAAAKTATAKIAIAHLPLKLPPTNQKFPQNPRSKRKSSVLVSEDPVLKTIFPLIAKLEQKNWPFKKELTHSDVGYCRKHPKPIKDKNYFIAKVLSRLTRKYGDLAEIEKILNGDFESQRNEIPAESEKTENLQKSNFKDFNMTEGPSGLQNPGDVDDEMGDEEIGRNEGFKKSSEDWNSDDSCDCISEDENDPQLSDLEEVISREIMILHQKENSEDTSSDSGSESDSGDESEDDIDVNTGSGFSFLNQVKKVRRKFDEGNSEEANIYRFNKIKFSNKFLTFERLIQRINERVERMERGSKSPTPEPQVQHSEEKTEENIKKDLAESDDEIQILN